MSSRLAIMQPYWFPYIGYFQLMNYVDEFVIYDNIKYTKKGWINRNRIINRNNIDYVTLPLKSATDSSFIIERRLADTWGRDRTKMINKLNESYRAAPYFSQAMYLIEATLMFESENLFEFLFNSIKTICNYCKILCKLTIASTIEIDSSLKGQSKVVEICKKLNMTNYVNPIGGIDLYKSDDFAKEGITISFLRSSGCRYNQFNAPFRPDLSMIDVIMFNSTDMIRSMLDSGFEIYDGSVSAHLSNT